MLKGLMVKSSWSVWFRDNWFSNFWPLKIFENIYRQGKEHNSDKVFKVHDFNIYQNAMAFNTSFYYFFQQSIISQTEFVA